MNTRNDYSAVILADGDYPRHSAPLGVLERAERVVCCDGAAAAFLRHTGRRPCAVVGDGDSLPPACRTLLAGLFHRVSEQEDNDLTKATRWCLTSGLAKPGSAVAYLGATGRREDHTLGNISLLVRYARDFGLRPVMITDHGTLTPHHGPATLRTFPGQQVSLFNMGCRALRSEGLRWEASPYAEWWQGTLNEALADTAAIEADGWWLAFLTHEAKTPAAP